MDLVYPATEQNAFFITTSHILTPNQTRSSCAGVGSCTVDSDCEYNEYDTGSQGIHTGICDNSTQTCQVYGWCPLESDSNLATLNNIGNFTVFVKIDIIFPNFGVSRSNAIDIDGTGKPVIGYNLFTIDQLLGNATNGEISSYESIATSGAILLMISNWDCNLDHSPSKCNPTYTFKRIDAEADSISYGYNFRAVDYNVFGTYRMLRKLYGVRAVFLTEGEAGKFSFAALTVTFGAGLAYLGIASILTDIVLEKFLRQSNKYNVIKNEIVNEVVLAKVSTQQIINPDVPVFNTSIHKSINDIY